MSRRSKLSLVTNKDLEKKQAAGFEVAAPDAARAGPSESPPSPGKAPASESPGAAPPSIGKAAVAPPLSRSAGRPWVKVVVVVALTALALFLLKRRIV